MDEIDVKDFFSKKFFVEQLGKSYSATSTFNPLMPGGNEKVTHT